MYSTLFFWVTWHGVRSILIDPAVGSIYEIADDRAHMTDIFNVYKPNVQIMIDSTIKIENIVASMALSDNFDLKHISSHLENAEYDKDKFPGLVYRIKTPKTAFLVFGSGKANCTGAKSIDDVDTAVEILSKDLEGLGYTITSKSYIVQNIVAGATLGTELDLDAIAIGLGFENVEYEPEVFPGLVYRIKDPKVVVLIFRSGKLVITGAKSQTDCETAKLMVWEQLNNLGLVQ